MKQIFAMPDRDCRLTRLFLLVLLLLVLTFIPRTFSNAQGDPTQTAPQITPTPPVTANDVNTASQNLYCPVCENLPLPVCPTVTCDEWRNEVRNLLEQGYDRSQIEAVFVQRYGEKAVGTPSNDRTRLFTVILPLALIVLFGFGVVIALVRGRSRQAAPESAQVIPPSDDPYRSRIERDL